MDGMAPITSSFSLALLFAPPQPPFQAQHPKAAFTPSQTGSLMDVNQYSSPCILGTSPADPSRASLESHPQRGYEA